MPSLSPPEGSLAHRPSFANALGGHPQFVLSAGTVCRGSLRPLLSLPTTSSNLPRVQPSARTLRHLFRPSFGGPLHALPLWGSPKHNRIKASQLQFLRFPRFRVRIFRIFCVVAVWNLRRPLFSGVGGFFFLTFSTFSPFWVRIADSIIRLTDFIMTGLRLLGLYEDEINQLAPVLRSYP